MAKSSNKTAFKNYESRSPNGFEKGYIRVTPSQIGSDAVRDLGDKAYRMFMDMKFVAKGHDKVVYSRKLAYKNLGISNETFKKIIDKLVEVGLIEKLPRGCYGATSIIFSDKWKEYKSPRRDALTNEYVYPKRHKENNFGSNK